MIRKLTTKEELENMHALPSYAFNAFHTEEQKNNFLLLSTYSDNYGVFTDDQLNSLVMSYPFEVSIKNRVMKMSGIGNVSTYPEYRGEGGIRQLFIHIFEELYKDNVELSYLAPFSQAFYRKFGYEKTFNSPTITIANNVMALIPNEKSGSIKRVEWKDDSIKNTIKELYKETLEKEDGTVIRPDWWWDYVLRHYPKRKLAIAYDDNKKANGN